METERERFVVGRCLGKSIFRILTFTTKGFSLTKRIMESLVAYKPCKSSSVLASILALDEPMARIDTTGVFAFNDGRFRFNVINDLVFSVV